MIFANLWGFLFLLAIPPIIVMHMLQRRNRRVVSSTLFLLKKTTPISRSGKRFDKLRHSLPLYLQLLAVLLITWLLIEPSWLRKQEVLKVAAVIDSSLSMQAFQSKLAPTIEKNLRPLIEQAEYSELHILSSRAEDALIYSGGSLDEALLAIDKWQPSHTAHAIDDSLQNAENLINNEGLTVLISDYRRKIPERYRQILIGEKINNIGFAGLTTQKRQWAVLIRNYGNQQCEINIQGSDNKTRQLTLAAGQLKELKGQFPNGADDLTLTLPKDAFLLDNKIHILSEIPKKLNFSILDEKARQNEFWLRFSDSIKNTSALTSQELTEGNTPDFIISPADPLKELPGVSGIFYRQAPMGSTKLLQAMQNNSGLTHGLQWQGLTASGHGKKIINANTWQTLLWADQQPLIAYREINQAHQLLFCFDPFSGNAFDKPSSLILLQRFIEKIRHAKKSYYRRNFELNQIIPTIGRAVLKTNDKENPAAIINRAPASVKKFSLWQDQQKTVDGAAYFADIQEANFSNADSFSNIDSYRQALVSKNARQDFFRDWFYLLLILTLGAIWYLSDRKKQLL